VRGLSALVTIRTFPPVIDLDLDLEAVRAWDTHAERFLSPFVRIAREMNELHGALDPWNVSAAAEHKVNLSFLTSCVKALCSETNITIIRLMIRR